MSSVGSLFTISAEALQQWIYHTVMDPSMSGSTLGTIPAATIGTDTFSAQCSYQAWQSFTLGAVSGNDVLVLDGLIVLLERATKNRSYAAKWEKLHWSIATYGSGHILLGFNVGPSPAPRDKWEFDRRVEVFLHLDSRCPSSQEQHIIRERWNLGSVNAASNAALVAIDPVARSAYLHTDQEKSWLTFTQQVPNVTAGQHGEMSGFVPVKSWPPEEGVISGLLALGTV